VNGEVRLTVGGATVLGGGSGMAGLGSAREAGAAQVRPGRLAVDDSLPAGGVVTGRTGSLGSDRRLVLTGGAARGGANPGEAGAVAAVRGDGCRPVITGELSGLSGWPVNPRSLEPTGGESRDRVGALPGTDRSVPRDSGRFNVGVDLGASPVGATLGEVGADGSRASIGRWISGGVLRLEVGLVRETPFPSWGDRWKSVRGVIVVEAGTFLRFESVGSRVRGWAAAGLMPGTLSGWLRPARVTRG
jgi:hypothetical protein